MADLFGGARPRVLARKGGSLAAATVLAGAGLMGVATAGPELPGAPFSVSSVHHNVALVDFPTFAQSLQTLLDTMGVGDLNAVLGGFGDIPGTTTPLSVSADVSALLAALNPDGITLGGVGTMFGVSLTEPLYSTTGDSLLGAGGLFVVGGVPIGNMDLSNVIDVVLGAGAGEHSLTDLADAVGLGSMLSQYGSLIGALGLDNMNFISCTLSCGGVASIDTHPDLSVGSSLNDWLSGILKVPTTDVTQTVGILFPTTSVVPNSAYTLGEYLHTLTAGTTPLDQATLADLFHLTPSQPWDQYLDGLPFGGTLLDPSGEFLGEQTLGTFLSSLLPADSTLTIDGATPITDILEAFGLLNW